VVRRNVAAAAPHAVVIEAASPVVVERPELIAGKRVLVIEDGPTITHGGMPFGAGAVAARSHGAAELIDPRPYAVGSLAAVLSDHPHIGPVLPAMGYSDGQLVELAQTIEAAGPEAIVIGTPIDLGRIVDLGDIPRTRVFYELEEVSGPTLDEVLGPFLG